jgi:hypothetical protein
MEILSAKISPDRENILVTFTEDRGGEIARLQREIAERQARLQLLVLGDPIVGVEFKTR